MVITQNVPLTLILQYCARQLEPLQVFLLKTCERCFYFAQSCPHFLNAYSLIVIRWHCLSLAVMWQHLALSCMMHQWFSADGPPVCCPMLLVLLCSGPQNSLDNWSHCICLTWKRYGRKELWAFNMSFFLQWTSCNLCL